MTRYRIILFLILLAVLFVGAWESWKYYEKKQASKTDISFLKIADGKVSGYTRERNLTFQTPAELQDAWEEIWSHTYVPELPGIDFGSSTVIGVFYGLKPTAGYSIEIKRIEPRDENIVVHAVQISPGSGCSLAEVQTAPYEIVGIPKTDKKIIFEIEKQVNDCR